jgi:hypothetical protein
MKVYEVISENTINEDGLGILARLAKGAENVGVKSGIKRLIMGPDKDFIEKAAQELADLTKSNTTLAKSATPVEDALKIKRAQLENEIDSGIYQAKKLPANQGKSDAVLRAEVIKRNGIDPRYFDPNIEAKLISNANQRVITHSFGKTGDFIDWASSVNVVESGLKLWGWYELAQPVRDYAKNMSRADQYLEVGPPKGFTREQYNAYQNQQMSLMLSRMGALILVGWATHSNFIIRALKESKLLSPTVTYASLVANGYFKHLINTPGATEAIATVAMSDIVAGNTELGFPGLGSLGVDAKNSLQRMLGFDNSAQSDSNAAPASTTNGSKQDRDSTSSKPSADVQSDTRSSSSVGTSTGPDLSKYVQRSDNPNLIWDPTRPLSVMLKPPGWQPSN